METTISTRHGTLAAGDHAYIEKKIPKFTHLFDRIQSVKVTVDFTKENGEVHPAVEILVNAEHRHDFVAREQAKTVAEAFDLAEAKMEMQLRRYKEKVQNHKGRTSMAGDEG